MLKIMGIRDTVLFSYNTGLVWDLLRCYKQGNHGENKVEEGYLYP